MSKTLGIKFDPSLAIGQIDKISAACLDATRAAAQAGAQVYYEEVLLRVPVGAREFHWFHGKSFKTTGQKYLFKKGDLKRSIYQGFSDDNSKEYSGSIPVGSKTVYEKATYHVSWRYQPGKKGEQHVPYGFMVEQGTSRAPAHPFIRPTYDAKKIEVLNTMEKVWLAETRNAL